MCFELSVPIPDDLDGSMLVLDNVEEEALAVPGHLVPMGRIGLALADASLSQVM